MQAERLVFSKLLLAYSAGRIYIYTRISMHTSEELGNSCKHRDLSKNGEIIL